LFLKAQGLKPWLWLSGFWASSRAKHITKNGAERLTGMHDEVMQINTGFALGPNHIPHYISKVSISSSLYGTVRNLE
jgi:hypothetical protein